MIKTTTFKAIILHTIKHTKKLILTETKVASELGSQHPVQAAHSQVLALHPKSYLGNFKS